MRGEDENESFNMIEVFYFNHPKDEKINRSIVCFIKHIVILIDKLKYLDRPGSQKPRPPILPMSSINGHLR